MGMRAHLIAVDEAEVEQLRSMDGAELMDVLRGPDALEIDKSWEAVFTLIGSIAGTGMMLVDDPIPVGDDLGFGPAMLIDSSTTAAIAGRLGSTSDDELEAQWASIDSPFMTPGLYDDEDSKQFAMTNYRRCIDLFRAAEKSSKMVLFAIV